MVDGVSRVVGARNGARDDARVARSARGIEAVRRVTLVSNDIAVHAFEVDVLPGPGWADLSSGS